MKNWSIALADTILARFPDPDTIPYRRWCYVQGYVLCGFEKLWSYTGDPKYFDYLRRFVDQHVLVRGARRHFAAIDRGKVSVGRANENQTPAANS